VIKGERDAIRFGLNSIKNFGEGIGTSIIAERKKGGPFKSLVDFLTRIKDKNLNKKSLESLIKSGAMDNLGERGVMLGNLDDLLKFNKEAHGVENQDSLFGLMTDTSTLPTLRLKPAEPAAIADKLMWEKELLGLYVSGHPLDKYKEKLATRDMTIKEVKEMMREGMQAIAYGLLEEVKPILTKGGDKMLFVKIADYSGSIEAVVFPKTLKLYEQIFMPEACIAVKGRLSNRNGIPSIVVEKAKSL
jgi:DNA polymerase-3 subunit alpha